MAGAFVRVAARAGEVALSVGLARGGGGVREGGGDGMGMLVDGDGAVAGTGLDEYTKTMGREVARECQGMGGTLEAVGQVIEACLSDEILKSKYVASSSSPIFTSPHLQRPLTDPPYA